ncbi:methyl-accepting chemotaxis protein [bacterium 1XD42-1]|nr:methyl-accepting chemotaxis protein [bacterium 1XD42-1]
MLLCEHVLILILLVVLQVRRVIGQPVKELSLVATRIAKGELDQTIHYHSKDELGVLADDFNHVTLRLRDYVTYIEEISEKLREIAGGNLAFTLENEYTGEFEKIKTALDEISYSLNITMGQIHAASRDVAAGAEQVSNGATTLSQGSTEQAAEVETLAGHIEAVSDSIHKVAKGAQEASHISQEVKSGLLASNDKMQNMTMVIQRISDKSTEIHKIVKTIEEIAFQTNILALNAAVEAARAGAVGKGFAVVADEVRALAGKSSEAAQETTVLLRQTVDSMDEGVHAAQDTADSMLVVVDQADKMSKLIDGIAEYTKQQDADAEEITRGIEQISTVVQTNVSTVEESAAASEELSGQASMLRDLVAKFQLRD